MGSNSVPKFIFRLSRFPVYRGSVLGRFYCITRKPKMFGVCTTGDTAYIFKFLLHTRHHVDACVART